MQEVFVSVDVAEDRVGIDHPGRGSRRIANTLAAVRTFAAAGAEVGLRIVFAASGGHDRLLRDAPEAHGVRFGRVDPRRACSPRWAPVSVLRRPRRRIRHASCSEPKRHVAAGSWRSESGKPRVSGTRPMPRPVPTSKAS